ncbi:MAG: cation:proton antiporter [Thermoanaerobaculia bacterium]|nr:cation:proton antiporter [Thermoanaerobaculia bacterium]
MSEIPYLQDVIVLFGTALAVLVVSYRLKMGPIVGFLLTGMLVGPAGAGWIRDTHQVEIFAELGVVFLLFGIGLEISFDRLRRLARFLIVGGGLQVGATIGLVAGLALLFGQPSRTALFLGMVVSLSSTAIVMKRYLERRELEAPHGQVSTGILLCQDFLIVPFLLLVPVLAGTTETTGREVLWRFGGGLLIVAIVFGLGRLLVPKILALVVHTEVRELFVIGSLLACLGGALVTETLGFSLALGAFLAGILLSESEYHHQVIAETGPFRDVFNSVFFISVGMLVQLDYAVSHLTLVLGLTAAVIALKGVVVFAAVSILRFPFRTSVIAALGLAQIGELSFLLARAGHQNGLLGDQGYQLILAVAVLTMLLTPGAMALASRIADRSRRTLDASESPEPAVETSHHVVVVGYGLNARHLLRVLDSARTRHVVIEANGAKIRQGTEAGRTMLYGDATRPEILRRANIESAPVLVVAMSDPVATISVVRSARQLNPRVHIIARTRRLAEIEELTASGANEVVAEEFETSLEIVTAVLQRLHVPGNIIRSQARLLRADGYQMLRSPAPSQLSEPLRRALAVGTTDSFLLGPEHKAVGETLRSLDLRSRTGATVLAVVRGDAPMTSPAADLEFEPHDVLVLVGGHAALDAAFDILEELE